MPLVSSGILFCNTIASSLQIWLQPNLSSKNQLDPALAKFEIVKSATALDTKQPLHVLFTIFRLWTELEAIFYLSESSPYFNAYILDGNDNEQNMTLMVSAKSQDSSLSLLALTLITKIRLR